MLAKRLKQARLAKKFTQEQLASKVNTQKTTISNYETGYSSPSNEMLADLANSLEVTSDYLLGRVDTPQGFKIDYSKTEKNTYDPLAEINKLIKQFGIEQFGFFDIEKWKHFTPEDVEDLRKHFEWVAHKAKERNEEKK
jgi:transcriptional regulator with XRE-family HTH domain